MKKNIVYLLLFFVLLSCEEQQKTDDQTVKLQKGEVIQTVRFIGKMMSASKKLITAPYDAQVEILKVQNGSKVSKNQTLLVLKSKELADKFDKESRELKNLEIQKSSLDAQLKKAEIDLARAKKALKNRAISSSEAEDFQVQTLLASNKLKSLLVNIEEMRRSVALTQELLQKSEIKAPAEGTIAETWVGYSDFTTGSQVKSGDLLMSIVENGDLKMRAMVPDYFASQLLEKQTVTVQNQGLQKKTWSGQIVSVLSSSKFDGQFEVLVRLAPEAGILRIGSELLAAATVAQKNETYYLPKSAVAHVGDEFYVQKKAGSSYNRTSVTPGIIGDERVEIIKGLAENEDVLRVFR